MNRNKTLLALLILLLLDLYACKNFKNDYNEPYQLKDDSSNSRNKDPKPDVIKECGRSVFDRLQYGRINSPKIALRPSKEDVSKILKSCAIKSYELTEKESCLDFNRSKFFPLSEFVNNIVSSKCSMPEKIRSTKDGIKFLPAKGSRVGKGRNRRRRSGGLFHFTTPRDTCDGSLIISHDSKNGILFDDFSKLRLKGERFPMLKVLTNREIFLIEVDGNCSWKLFSQHGFRGRSTVITSATYNLDFHPKSAIKLQ